MSNKYYVEVVASDGLAHHIGPFEKRSSANAWIRQHASAVPTTEPDMSENMAAIHLRQTGEGLS